MIAIEQIQQLSSSDKCSLIEQLWESMSPDEVAVPTWHQDLLDKRESLIEQGKAHFVDWNIAKQQIQKMIA